MTSYKEIHKACVVAYIDSADTAIRNALEDGEDIVLYPTETQRLKEALKVTKSIMSRLLDEIEYDEEEPEELKEPLGEFFKDTYTLGPKPIVAPTARRE